MFQLSQNEIYNHKTCSPLDTDFQNIQERIKDTPDAAPTDIYTRIYNGSMPQLVNGEITDKDRFYQSYIRTCLEPHLNYYRDKDGKEIDVLWEENGTLYPLEIKKTFNPDARLTNIFHVLEKSNKTLGQGGVICLKNDFLPLNKNNGIIPIRCI